MIGNTRCSVAFEGRSREKRGVRFLCETFTVHSEKTRIEEGGAEGGERGRAPSDLLCFYLSGGSMKEKTQG